MKKGDTVEIIDRLGTYYAIFEEIDESRLDILCKNYFSVPLDDNSHVYKSGRWSIAGIKSIRVIEGKEYKRFI